MRYIIKKSSTYKTIKTYSCKAIKYWKENNLFRLVADRGLFAGGDIQATNVYGSGTLAGYSF